MTQVVANTVVKAARWLDAEQTKLVVITDYGIGNWPANSLLGQKAQVSVIVHPFYTVKHARWHEDDHTKLLARVEEHGDEVELLGSLWPDVPVGRQPPPIPRAAPLAPVAAPAPLPELELPLMPELPMPRRHPWSLEQLLERASDPPPEPERIPVTEPALLESVVPVMDDAARRRQAKAHIRRIAAAFAFEANTEALRYEQALLAHNGNIAAIQDMEMEAMAAGIGVKELAERIIDGRRLHSRRMLRVKAVHDDALKALDTAQGDGITAIEEKAAAEMTG